MNIDVLDKHGIPGQVVKRWRASGMKFLLPVQAECVSRFGILDGNSLVICGPGTSGKTFCGEMAALRSAAAGRRAVFLVPLKAIAEEKYRLFEERYGPLGIRVALATRDHADAGIARGDFDILISIYEKFNSLTAADITLIRNAGCFILDEFQMIMDNERGPELELLMAKIRSFNPGSQLLVLMGEGTGPGEISEWLNFPCLEENRRPVDLRLGILHRGTFHFRAFNDLREGEELWLEKRDIDMDAPLGDQVTAAVEMLLRKGEQVIVFVSAKKECVNIALRLAERLNLSVARKCVNGLADLAPSIQNELLARCLHGGLAFHHAELDSDQRRLVEEGFRSGEIRALISTTTLAWGVNLPAKNVFIEIMKYEGTRSANGRAMQVPISVTDFHQAAGRAGRLGSGDGFGRAIMAASTPYEHEVLWERYVYSRNIAPRAQFDRRRLVDLCLRLVACGAGGSVETITSVVSRLYCHHNRGKNDDVSSATLSSLEYLRKEEFIKIADSGTVDSTAFGRATCSCGLSTETAARISSAARDNEIDKPLEWLFFALGLREWMDNAGYFSEKDIAAEELYRRLYALSDGLIDRSEYLASNWRLLKSPDTKRRFVHFHFILEWIAGKPTRDLERLYDRGGGGLKRDAETISWLLNGVEKLLRCCGPKAPDKTAAELSRLSAQMKYGVVESLLSLAEILRIDREFIRLLHELGIKSPNDLHEIDYQSFKNVLPATVIERIRSRSAERLSVSSSPDINLAEPSLIRFTGEVRNRLKEVVIDGKSIFMQPKLHSYLRKLWWGVKSQDPWIHKDSLEPGFNQARYISKLRKTLRNSSVELVIISDGAGSYRLILPERVEPSDVGPDYEHVGVNGR